MNFITLTVYKTKTDEYVDIEMPGATSGYRAAQRVADELGMDPESPDTYWALAYWPEWEVIGEDEVIGDYDGETVVIMSKER